MRREGSALRGVGAVTMKELADNLSSARMRLLEILIFVAGAGRGLRDDRRASGT